MRIIALVCQRIGHRNRRSVIDINAAGFPQPLGIDELFQGTPGLAGHLREKLFQQAPPSLTVFDDPEIYQSFASNLHRVREPSLRHYVCARELKATAMDWTDVLAVEDENRRARLAAELLDSDAHGSTTARVKAFVE